jgi:hypothetical protein
MDAMSDQSDKASILLRMTVDRRARIQEIASAAGMSVNAYMLKAVDMVAPFGPTMSDTPPTIQPNDLGDLDPANFKTVEDAMQGDVRLEEIKDFRLYDTQFHLNPYQWPKGMMDKLLAAEPPPVYLFKLPNIAGGRAFSNMDAPGCLFWPRRMLVHRVELIADRPLPKEMLRQLSMRFVVGEKPCGESSLTTLPEISGIANSWALTVANVWLPSVQHFSVELLTGGLWLGEIEWRCTLVGSFYREIL